MAQPKRQRRSSMGVRRVGGRCSRGGGDVAGLHRELDGRARVRRVLLRAGEVREECLPGSRSCRLASSLRDGPGDCQRARVLLDHVHAYGLERRVLRGGGVLGSGGMRAEAVCFARRAVHILFAPTAGVNVSRVPQVPAAATGPRRTALLTASRASRAALGQSEIAGCRAVCIIAGRVGPLVRRDRAARRCSGASLVRAVWWVGRGASETQARPYDYSSLPRLAARERKNECGVAPMDIHNNYLEWRSACMHTCARGRVVMATWAGGARRAHTRIAHTCLRTHIRVDSTSHYQRTATNRTLHHLRGGSM